MYAADSSRPRFWRISNLPRDIPFSCQTSSTTPTFVHFLRITNSSRLIAGFVDPRISVFQIYAASQPFEIKALGSAYPDASATPGSGSSSGTPSSTSSGSNPSSSANNNSSNNSGGSRNVLSALGAFAAIVVGVITA